MTTTVKYFSRMGVWGPVIHTLDHVDEQGRAVAVCGAKVWDWADETPAEWERDGGPTCKRCSR